MNHLSGLRCGKTKLAGHHIDARGLGELGLGQAQLAVLFAQLVERLLLLLDAVAAFNGVEVLQGVDHDEGEEHSESGGRTGASRVPAPGRTP